MSKKHCKTGALLVLATNRILCSFNQCFDTVSWVIGRASSLNDLALSNVLWESFGDLA